MALVTRTAKPNGGTSWTTNEVLESADLEGDVAAVVTQINGNLDSANIASGGVGTDQLAAGAVTDAKVSASAAIALSKIDQTSAGALGADAVDDHSDNAATARAVADPGDSGTPSLATNLEEELERLRYAIKRLSLGVNADITDGSTPATWYDGAARPENLLHNGSFLDDSATPQGWTINNAGSLTVAPTAFSGADLVEGLGKYLKFSDAAGADTDGFQQSFSPKRSGKYLVTARVRDNTGDVRLRTTGATGTFGNLDQTSDTGAWATLAGIVQADTTPTAIVVRVSPGSGTTNFDFDVAWVAVQEITEEDQGLRGGGIVLYAASTSGTEATVEAALDLSVIPPAPGYSIEIEARVNGAASGTDVVEIELNENASKVSENRFAGAGGNEEGVVTTSYVNTAPTPGTVYNYTVQVILSGSAALVSGLSHTLTVRLVRP